MKVYRSHFHATSILDDIRQFMHVWKNMITIKSPLKFSTSFLTPYCLYISPLVTHLFSTQWAETISPKTFQVFQREEVQEHLLKLRCETEHVAKRCKECCSWCKLSVFHRNKSSSIPNLNNAATARIWAFGCKTCASYFFYIGKLWKCICCKSS